MGFDTDSKFSMSLKRDRQRRGLHQATLDKDSVRTVEEAYRASTAKSAGRSATPENAKQLIDDCSSTSKIRHG